MEIPTNTTLYGRHSIIGRTFVIHGGVDPASGNAGPRMACGIVESEKVDTYFGKQLQICKSSHGTQILREKPGCFLLVCINSLDALDLHFSGFEQSRIFSEINFDNFTLQIC